MENTIDLRERAMAGVPLADLLDLVVSEQMVCGAKWRGRQLHQDGQIDDASSRRRLLLPQSARKLLVVVQHLRACIR